MRHLRICLIVFSAVVFLPSQAAAQSISFDANKPESPAAGRISGTGTIQYDNTKYKLNGVKIIAFLPGGGRGGESVCLTDTTGKVFTWNGQISNLPPGTYKVYARLWIRLIGDTPEYYYDTKLAEVVVK